MWEWLHHKPCPACAVKDEYIQELKNDRTALRTQLAYSREREEKAVDALLERKQERPITPTPRMTMKDSENAQREAFGIFVDADDTGDGKIREVDNLGGPSEI